MKADDNPNEYDTISNCHSRPPTYCLKPMFPGKAVSSVSRSYSSLFRRVLSPRNLLLETGSARRGLFSYALWSSPEKRMSRMKEITSKQTERLHLLTGLPEAPTSKKRKKKKKAKLAADFSLEAEGEDSPTAAIKPGRPGKKKMRKLRYQQNHHSATQFLLSSAEACSFTGSVASSFTTSRPAEDVGAGDLPSNYLPPGTRIEVVTSCTLPVPASFVQNSGQETSPVHRIHVQPLLVLDLNGILCHRIRAHRDPDVPKTAYRQATANIANTPVIPRTDLIEFLSFLDGHFCLAVWTSAKSKNAMALAKHLFPPDIFDRLVFVWSQHACDVIEEQGETIFEKNLAKVWKESPMWNSHNTILIDDSRDKCQRWHLNAVHPPKLHGRKSHELEEGIMADEVNEKLQREFFMELVENLNEKTVIVEWVATESGPLPSATESDESLPYTLTSPPVILDHLREKAVGHMGWS
jgi:hypothetical protein